MHDAERRERLRTAIGDAWMRFEPRPGASHPVGWSLYLLAGTLVNDLDELDGHPDRDAAGRVAIEVVPHVHALIATLHGLRDGVIDEAQADAIAAEAQRVDARAARLLAVQREAEAIAFDGWMRQDEQAVGFHPHLDDAAAAVPDGHDMWVHAELLDDLLAGLRSTGRPYGAVGAAEIARVRGLAQELAARDARAASYVERLLAWIAVAEAADPGTPRG